MRIIAANCVHADGGWRPFSFLKLETDAGLIGWSEFSCGTWAPELPAVIERLAQAVIGRDARAFALLSAELHAAVRFAPGGLNHQAIGAIENACIDLAAKAAGVPVHRLWGGPYRGQLELYWSHCGSFRGVHKEIFTDVLNLAPVNSLDDIKALGAQVRARGFSAAKINPIMFEEGNPVLLNPGFLPHGLDHGRRASRRSLEAIEAQVAAFCEGAGEQAQVMLDINFALSTEGAIRLARRLEPFKLKWLEYDNPNPRSMTDLRRAALMPIASLESIYGRRAYAPFLETSGVDVAVIDVLWNGFAEAVRIATLAESFEVNVAPHNFYGPLSDLIAAHFSASVPNFEIMEIEADDVPWKYDFLTQRPVIENGKLHLPTGAGWGADIDEAQLAKHPWPRS